MRPTRFRFEYDEADYHSGESLGHRAIMKEETARMLSKEGVGVKSLIMFLKDSGLRVSDVKVKGWRSSAQACEMGVSVSQSILLRRRIRSRFKPLFPQISNFLCFLGSNSEIFRRVVDDCQLFNCKFI